MLKKRGQLTLFVIIGVVIVAAILGYFLINQEASEPPINNEKVIVLRENTLDCFNNIYVNALVTIGFQGGYNEVTDGIYNGFVSIPYYYKQGNLNVPSREIIENELADYINVATPFCIGYEDVVASSETLGLNITSLDLVKGNFSGYETSYKENKANVKIVNGEVIFTNDIDLTVKDGEGNAYIIKFEDYSKRIKSDIYSMHEIASYIATSLKEDDESTCLSCLQEMAEENDLTVDIMGYLSPEDEIIIISNNVTSAPVVFQIINKYKVIENDAEGFF